MIGEILIAVVFLMGQAMALLFGYFLLKHLTNILADKVIPKILASNKFSEFLNKILEKVFEDKFINAKGADDSANNNKKASNETIQSGDTKRI